MKSPSEAGDGVLFSIGEFSRITGLTIKALRLYHEKRILVPARIDEETGYRYYNRGSIDRARVIHALKRLDFTLGAIEEILANCSEEADTLAYLQRQSREIARKMDHYSDIANSLNQIIQLEKEAVMKSERNEFDVEEKEVESQLVAGIRYRGRYEDCGRAFGTIGKTMGRFLCGKPMNLYYDAEYKENDADIESCIPVRKGREAEGITVRELKGGRCVSLIHKGAYDQISHSYEKIARYVKEKGYRVEQPSREIYLKGPGMIFRGNPNNYLTEIQMMIH